MMQQPHLYFAVNLFLVNRISEADDKIELAASLRYRLLGGLELIVLMDTYKCILKKIISV